MAVNTRTTERVGIQRTPKFFQAIPFANGELEFAAVYVELRKIAIGRLRSASPGLSLGATMLVNEACLKLIRACVSLKISTWTSKVSFLAAASEVMRQVVVDHYRRKHRLKRGGDRTRVHLDIGSIPDDAFEVGVLELNEALEQFELVHPTKAELVKLRFFVGMTMPECAAVLNISLPTAERHWRFARAWLAVQLGN